ncbi:hypothetical protein [Streptomyces sp. CB01635]|uniref:hypothetical protein n=1 Tax=unclassified Streptomyces TaxID=2593676 RepID=UPI001F1B3981|nr:hypothetical protein [Streptomyces sp. CB01635]
MDQDQTLAARQGETRGSRIFSFKKGQKGDALIIAVRCQGKGELKVSVKTVHAAFPLACVDGEVSTTYNMVNMSGADKEGTVAVTAPSAVRWSMTIGRGEPPKEER